MRNTSPKRKRVVHLRNVVFFRLQKVKTLFNAQTNHSLAHRACIEGFVLKYGGIAAGSHNHVTQQTLADRNKRKPSKEKQAIGNQNRAPSP